MIHVLGELSAAGTMLKDAALAPTKGRHRQSLWIKALPEHQSRVKSPPIHRA
jgi:hypothetical protein